MDRNEQSRVKLTVFTATLNRLGTLHRVHQSLESQTMRDFEWLVIDDGSSDGTPELVANWQAQSDFPIRLVCQGRCGTAAAFNRAITLARGVLFFQIDSDDGCLPNALETLWDAWCQIPEQARLGYAGLYTRSCDEYGRANGPGLGAPWRDATFHEQYYRFRVREDQRPCWVTEVIRYFQAPILNNFSGWLPEGLTAARVGRKHKSRWLNDILYVYYQHDGINRISAPKESDTHWRGLRAQYKEQVALDARWSRYAPRQFYQRAAAYARFSFRLGMGPAAQWQEIGTALGRAIWLAALPAGVVLRLKDRRIARQVKPAQALNSSRPAVLYITYDGLLEGLGQSQVLPYLRELSGDFAITVMSFEKPRDWADLKRRRGLKERLDRAAITWIPMRYHKRPSLPATAFDIVHGVVRGIGAAMRRKPEIVHVRGYVPGVIGLALKSVAGARFIFDMRGFWPEEKVDAGAWQRNSAVYRAAKWVEQKLLHRADVVVSLTQAGVKAMGEFPCLRSREVRFEVIPTCADLALFQPSGHRNGHDRGRFVLGYAGSVGTFYLFDEVLECFRELLKERPDARLLVVNRGAHDYIHERVKALGTPVDRVELHSAEHHEVPEYLRRMDAGAFFIKPTFSKKSSAPTRLGEFLGCGVPCLINAGVGDMDSVVSREHVGIVMREFSPEARRTAVRELLALCIDEGTRTRCVQAARRHFSLEQGVAAYRKIYRELGNAEQEFEQTESDSQNRAIGYEREYSRK